MSVQTVHFFRPPPPSSTSVQTNIFGFQNMGFTHNIYCATTKLTLILSLFDMLQLIGLAKYYDLQISVNIVYFQI